MVAILALIADTPWMRGTNVPTRNANYTPPMVDMLAPIRTRLENGYTTIHNYIHTNGWVL